MVSSDSFRVQAYSHARQGRESRDDTMSKMSGTYVVRDNIALAGNNERCRLAR